MATRLTPDTLLELTEGDDDPATVRARRIHGRLRGSGCGSRSRSRNRAIEESYAGDDAHVLRTTRPGRTILNVTGVSRAGRSRTHNPAGRTSWGKSR